MIIFNTEPRICVSPANRPLACILDEHHLSSAPLSSPQLRVPHQHNTHLPHNIDDDPKQIYPHRILLHSPHLPLPKGYLTIPHDRPHEDRKHIRAEGVGECIFNGEAELSA